jgi:hypothetical protein
LPTTFYVGESKKFGDSVCRRTFFFYSLINTRKKGEEVKIKSCVSEQERKKNWKERGKDEKSRRKRDREKNRLLYKLYFIGL